MRADRGGKAPKRRPLDDHAPDAFLAADAAARKRAIVTRNAGEFRHTGAVTVDPWAA